MSRVKFWGPWTKGQTPPGASPPKASGVNGRLADGFASRLRLAIQRLSDRIAAYSSSSRAEFLAIPAMAPRAQSAARRKG